MKVKEIIKNEGLYLQSSMSKKRNLVHQKGVGKVLKYWKEGEVWQILINTGLKKDALIEVNEKNVDKELLNSCLKSKLIPYIYSRGCIEYHPLGTVAYEVEWELRQQEINSLGDEKYIFGFFKGSDPKMSSDLENFELNAKILSSEEYGYWVKAGDITLFLPKSESLKYYNSKLNLGLYKKEFLRVWNQFLDLEIVLKNLDYKDLFSNQRWSLENLREVDEKLVSLLCDVEKIGELVGENVDNLSYGWLYLSDYIKTYVEFYRKVLYLIEVVRDCNIGEKSSSLIAEKKLITKVKDWKILKCVGLLNKISILDRNSLVYKALLTEVLETYLKKELKVIADKESLIKDGLFKVSIQKLMNTRYRVTAVSRKRGLLLKSDLEKITGYRYKPYKQEIEIKGKRVKLKEKEKKRSKKIKENATVR